MSRNILVVGQSHIAAIRSAAKTRRERDPEAPRTRVIHTLEPHYGQEMIGHGADARFGDALAETIRDQIDRHAPLLASAMGGNYHNALSLIRHPRPFDFRLSEEEQGPPLDPEAELIPEAQVRAALAQGLERDVIRLRLLAGFRPFIHLESPPPVRDDAFIAEQADAYFREQGIASQGVSPAGLRWRIWRLNSRLLREAIEAIGGRFLPVPPETRDPQGFLLRDFAGDATHGNEAYGEALIRALEAA